MAQETRDYQAALEYMDRAKIRECYVAEPDAPEALRNAGMIPYLGLGLPTAPAEASAFQVFLTGWEKIEGVMILTPETEFDADMRVGIAADNERALRDLLLAFPAGKVGFFYVGGAWMLPAMTELLDGRVMPSREGYYASEETFAAWKEPPARRLAADEYALVRRQWSEDVWQWLMENGHTVHACFTEAQPAALCFHWQVAPWRNEVHGLQAVRDNAGGYAESVVSSATAEVIAQGKIATCTANLSTNVGYLRAFRNVGYRPFYRIPSFRGIKRGSGRCIDVSDADFFGNTRRRQRTQETVTKAGEGRRIVSSKDPLLALFRDLAHAAGRQERAQFLVEGSMLVQRAVNDGLPVAHILYTPDLLRAAEGVILLNEARLAGIDHFLVTEGLMGKVTTTRPVPTTIAAVCAALREAWAFKTDRETALLAVENVNNPDNLGMLLRTADAAGATGVLMLGEKPDPFHKNCVRAARGAVGRIPLLSCRDAPAYLRRLRAHGFQVVGATGQAETELYRCAMNPPISVVVGNEQTGISPAVLEACTVRVRIPMAPGQDSLNVGIAAGVLLYEVVRQRGRGEIAAA